MCKNAFMQMAINEAMQGITCGHGGPFGAVVVKNGKIIGKGHNQVLSQHDPTCHGEIMAIRDACKNTGTHDLSDCILYTTAAPCPMCKGAILWANIKEVYYGCTIEDTDRIGFRDEHFYHTWYEQSDDNFGQECSRADCLELFEKYQNMQHEIY